MANAPSNFDAFLERVAGLDIQVSRSDDGVLTACTLTEPLFCHDADTREALESLVNATLASYARHFYGIESLGVRTEDKPLAEDHCSKHQVTKTGSSVVFQVRFSGACNPIH